MRDILFKGKRIFGEYWVCGDLIQFGNRTFIANGWCLSVEEDVFDMFDCDIVYEVAPETVGQFTGIVDKNDKQIFEGDIFQLEDDVVAVVVFSDGCFRLEEYGLCGTWTESGYDECGGGYGIIECEPIDWYFLKDMEVIGNIHDNPDLIPH